MSKLPITEELDFHYLLGLMPALTDEPEFAWLPELFSIIDYDSLIKLCKYAGGERIKIPTLNSLSNSIDALRWYYDVYIKKTADYNSIPIPLQPIIDKVVRHYAPDSCCRDAQTDQLNSNL